MSLIEFEGDIFVVSEIAAITREGTTVTITLKNGADAFDYDFKSIDQAMGGIARAVDVLLKSTP